MDGDEWESAPPKPRRHIFIAQKMKVVEYLKELRKQREKANQTLHERVPRRVSPQQKDALIKKRQDAKAILKRNILETCRQKFPDIVGSCGVYKWERQAEAEGWEQIPASDRVRWTEVPNSWRLRMKLPQKGRVHGGSVPVEICNGLDRLLAAHVLGASDISERKEVVSWDSIDAWA